jgi:hypothetical protein
MGRCVTSFQFDCGFARPGLGGLQATRPRMCPPNPRARSRLRLTSPGVRAAVSERVRWTA